MINHRREYIGQFFQHVVIKAKDTAPGSVIFIIIPGTVVNTEKCIRSFLPYYLSGFLNPSGYDRTPPVTPSVVVSGKDPLRLFIRGKIRNIKAGCLFKRSYAVSAETGLWKNGFRFLKLSVPVNVIHPDAVKIIFPEKLPEFCHPELPETGFSGTDAHEPGCGFHSIPVLVNSPRLRVVFDITLAVEDRKFGKNL